VGAIALLNLVTVLPAAAAPAFVQSRANEVTSGTTNTIAFANPPTAGNLIVVSVLWNNRGTVAVADNRANGYVSATPRTDWGSTWSSQVFYATNVAGGPTSVTATFGTAINGWGIVYIHEYSGIAAVNPIDGTRSAAGTTRAMSSGALTTTNPNDLLFAAAGSSHTVNRPPTGWTTRSTAYGNRTMDRTVTAVGSYAATANQSGNAWVMQLVAFKASTGSGDTTLPSVPTDLTATPASATEIDLAWTASTDNVGVAGYRVFRNGTSVGTPATTSFHDSGLEPTTTYSYTVSAFDAAGNSSAQSASASATTPASPADTTPPTVSMTAPSSGATVSGTQTVSADAADDVGVAGVQFLLDGSSLGAEDTVAPFAVTWDTTAVANGPHSLSARARDAAGNVTTSTAADVTVANAPAGPGDPAASYAFDEGTGIAAADASGHGVTGTLTGGATWGAGRNGNAVSLDGTDDHVDLANPAGLQLTGSMTISAWVNSSAFPADDAPVVSKRGSDGFQLDTTVDHGARTIGFKLSGSSGNDMFRYGATPMQANSWYHIAGVFNASTRSLDVYLNGQLDNGILEGTVTATQQDSPENVNVGRRPGRDFFFNGRIDDVRIYPRALTAAEVQTDMVTPVGSSNPSDPDRPTVSITSPANGSQVGGIVTVTADATDNVGVTGVQVYVDGAAVGVEDTSPPYGADWDTRTVANGAHTITARARDAAGNSTLSSPIMVNVANTSYFQNEVLATGFELPTNIEFLPDGRMLVVELAGTIKLLPAPYTQPSPTPFLELTNVGSAGVQQGIYDIALDPNFATNRYYYVFYTLGTPNRDRLARFTANLALTGTVPGSEFVLYQDPQTAEAEHHGGAVNFGNDGKIYFTTGEHFGAEVAQQLDNPRGKLHRINPDGTIPTDNPFHDGAGPNVDSIWAYGLRNPFRAYYDAPTGRLYIGDVGGNTYSVAREEVNLGVRGANYGWPESEGPCSSPCTSPIYSYPHSGRDASITGGFVYHGTQFPAAYQGSYFFADYTQNWIRRLTFDANGNVTGVQNFEPSDGSVDGPYGDIVYLAEGPDGALYYVDLGYSDIGGTFGVSKIRRIRYIDANQPPTAVAAADRTSGPVPLTVAFSSAGSVDPEGQPLTFSWTFGDGTTSTAANPTHTYASAGQYSARLSVSDGVNTTVSAPITVVVGSGPTATILTPQDGATFRAGDTISFSGDATDPEDGTLPDAGFTWKVDFQHEGHVHPGIPQSGVRSGSFTIPTSGHDYSGNTRYRITLTVTDSDGLTDTKVVTVWPQKVNLTFDTVPSGLTLHLDGIAKTTPFVYDTLVGFSHTVEARDQSAGGVGYTFASWSDGGARQHAVVVPAAAQTYSASYNASAVATPTFVQVNSATPQTPQSTVAVTYTGAQAAGDTNVIAIGWNSTASNVTSVTDSAGNTYQLAAPAARGNGLSQTVYYAKNITASAAGTNTVSVQFPTTLPYVDVRILEYSGLDPVNPLDATSSQSGSSATATSGNVTTTAANDLLFGAGMTTGLFNGSPAGFTTRIITPIDGDIANDRSVTSIGTYNAAATLSSSASWLMQVVAFRAAGQ
jgi:glucose/arabinose dehydrogenase/chitodextrinase